MNIEDMDHLEVAIFGAAVRLNCYVCEDWCVVSVTDSSMMPIEDTRDRARESAYEEGWSPAEMDKMMCPECAEDDQ